MKINEIITEAGVLDRVGSAVGKTVGGVAKSVGAVAGGVAGIPTAVKKGFQAGKATVGGEPTSQPQAGSVVQQAPGFRGMPVQPGTSSQQYISDIGAAARAGASSDISFKQATPTAAEQARAPVGTSVGQWTKTGDGWVNTQNNTAANPTQSAALDKKWYTETQKQARQQAQQKTTATGNQVAWDAKKKILSIDGQQYKKTAKGWHDIATDEPVDPKYSPELDTAFDQASGRAPVTGQTAQDTQTTQSQAMPDVNSLTPEERAELIRQVKQKLGQA